MWKKQIGKTAQSLWKSLGLLAVASLIACGGGSGEDVAPDGSAGVDSGYTPPSDHRIPQGYKDGECITNKRFFVEQVWAPVLAPRCLGCHNSFGQAKQSQFILQDAYQTGFLDRNLELFENFASYAKDGVPLLLLKPIGEDGHGGGGVLQKDSLEYNAIAHMLFRLQEPIECEEGIEMALFDGVQVLGPADSLRKVRLALTSSVPTDEELETMELHGLSQWDAVLDGVMEDPAFYEWLKEAYNDRFRINGYAEGNQAIDSLSSKDFPQKNWFEECDVNVHPQCLNEDFVALSTEVTNWSVAQDTLELIVHVVRNEKPFTEILTADYMMVNPYSAKVFGVDDIYFNNPVDVTEFRPAQVRLPTDEGTVDYPHAGVLSSPMVLNRYPTTDTNVNRHRARMVYDFFLATDVLKLAERSIDQSTITAHNPTTNEPACAVCHAVVDPVAGTYQNFNNAGRYRPPADGWHQDMRPPGFGAEVLPGTHSHKSLQWLGERLSADHRFVTSVVHTMFGALMGHPPLTPPSDPTRDDYLQSLSNYLQQDEYLKGVEQAFIENNYNLKSVIKELLRSPYFRGTNYIPPAAGTDGNTGTPAVLLDQVGTGRLLTPEQLDRRVAVLTGYPWLNAESGKSKLLDDYRFYYGGIDFDTNLGRIKEMTGMMANISQRMANEVACHAVPYDFTVPSEERKLFPYVDWDYAPTEKHGFRVPDMVEAMQQNVLYLHERLLGQSITIGSPEFERTYNLFLDVMEKGQELIKNDLASIKLPGLCRATMDLETGEDLPADIRMVNDADFTLRAWMAVVSYLMSDYHFLYE